MCIDYEAALNAARRQAARAKDGVLVHDGNRYSLAFDAANWCYVVFDSDDNHVITINEKTLKKARAFLVYWLNN